MDRLCFYSQIKGLKTEALQKLQKYQPVTLEKALQISGVDPSDVDILLYYLLDKNKNILAR